MSADRALPLRGVLCGLGAALLFGLSTPVAKLLLADAGPLVLAGLFYLGAAAGLSVAIALRRSERTGAEARLRGSDWRWLLAIAVLGGVLGPVLMLVGLARVPGVSGALLLNLEAPFTVLVAVVWFREHLGAAAAAALVLIVSGALVLSYAPGGLDTDLLGCLAIAAACLCWAVDNNCTQRLSLRDPFVISRAKAASAGVCTLGLALVLGQTLPPPPVILAAMAVGVVSYGVSIALDVYALRLLGAAREAALFATAPFAGALAAIPLLGERIGPVELAAATLMAAGVSLLLRERHSHLHVHEAMAHDHAHVHDEHHQHEHDGTEPRTEPHSHPHHHAPLVHDHPHVPDLHHRHAHGHRSG